MSKNHITTLAIENYRSFQSFRASNLKLVNIFGGTNGIGKSALLEALFIVADRGNPITLLRTYQMRQIPLLPADNLDALRQIYYHRDTSKPISFSAETGAGRINVTYTFGNQQLSGAVSQKIEQSELNKAASETSFTATGEGFHVKAQRGPRIELEARAQLASSGLLINITTSNPVDVPKAVLLNAAMRNNDAGIPIRYSSIKRRGQESKVLDFLKIVHPEILSLALLTIGGTVMIHADIGGGNMVPLPFLGEGAVSLTSAILAIAESTGGYVFLDEIDATVHHSKLRDMWFLLLKAAKDFDTQLFAATHSEESLEALVQAIGSLTVADVSYQRLRRAKSGDVEAVAYEGDGLVGALAQRWEVR